MNKISNYQISKFAAKYTEINNTFFSSHFSIVPHFLVIFSSFCNNTNFNNTKIPELQTRQFSQKILKKILTKVNKTNHKLIIKIINISP